VTRGGIIADVPATILQRMGVNVQALEPRLLGVPLSEPAPQRGRGVRLALWLGAAGLAAAVAGLLLRRRILGAAARLRAPADSG